MTKYRTKKTKRNNTTKNIIAGVVAVTLGGYMFAIVFISLFSKI